MYPSFRRHLYSPWGQVYQESKQILMPVRLNSNRILDRRRGSVWRRLLALFHLQRPPGLCHMTLGVEGQDVEGLAEVHAEYGDDGIVESNLI